MDMAKEEITRKGPWTEQEDMQLVCYVRLFGERRWDFLAKVSGLNRTGKSCRLRWVNYLHPGLKRGRMTPQEERLVIELHASWGNRWSRIARKLPGRTDNEIKNYWRTHMRKKAQESRKNLIPASASSATNHMSSNNESQFEVAAEREELRSRSSSSSITTTTTFGDNEEVLRSYSMDQIWNEIDSSEYTHEAWNVPCRPIHSPVREYFPDPMSKIIDEETRMFPPMGGGFLISSYNFGGMVNTQIDVNGYQIMTSI